MCRSGALLLFLLMAADLSAETILVNPNPIATANAISSEVNGADLAGLNVTATFGEASGPLVFPMTWAATGPGSGAASASTANHLNLSISVAGNAGASLAWQYTSNLLGPLLSLELDGTNAGIYFDRAHSGAGTPGSGPGADIAFAPLFPSGSSGIVATYSGAVSLDGAPPDNDLYANLLIDFPANFPPQDFAFTQPVDRNVVPEPVLWPVEFTGLAAFALLRCWRRRFRLSPPR